MWSQIVMAVMGVWLMVAPGVFGFSKNIADNAHIVGPLIATFSIIAASECTRNVRLFNLPLAVWLLAAPLVLRYDNDAALMNDYVVAIVIIFLFLAKPRRKRRFGGGWPGLWRKNTLHQREARQIRP